MASFREYFRTKIPGVWFEEDTWLEKITQIILMPLDIMTQVLNYIPRLRDIRNEEAPLDGMILEGKQRALPKYNIESKESYGLRVLNAWNDWERSGSRLGLFNVLIEVGYTPDTTTYEYGVQENITNLDNAYWADADTPSEHRNIVWDKFSWGGIVDEYFCFGIHISDPNNKYYSNQTRLNEIIDICRRFSDGHNRLVGIYFTDGSGNILNTYNF